MKIIGERETEANAMQCNAMQEKKQKKTHTHTKTEKNKELSQCRRNK